MSMSVVQARLKDALRDLRLHWSRTREAWDDDAARRFEAEFIEPLDVRVRSAGQGFARLGEVLAAAQRECSDDSGGGHL